jgi:PAS domain S-box-containing protein
MAEKKKSSLKKPKGVRRSDKTSVSKKSPALQNTDSKNLEKTIHEQRGSATKLKKQKIEDGIAQLASFPELNPIPIVEIDLMGQVLYLNPSADSLFPDLRSKGSNHPWIADFENLTVLVNRDSKKAHLREKKIGNSWYQQVIYSTPEWSRIRIYGYDITHQKQAEDLVRQSEERYRKLFEDDLTGDFLATSDGTILDCNPSFIKIFGFVSKEEGLDTNFLDLYPNHEEKEVFMNRLREKRKLEFYESVLLKRDGTFINVVENIVGHFDEQGNLKQFKGYLFDNTEHKCAEEKLKESERKYRELYEGSHDGFVMVNMEGHIKEFNHAYMEMLGYSEEELMKITYMDLTPKKWHAMEAKIIQDQVLSKGYSAVYEKEYIKKDGTIFPISLRKYLIKDTHGDFKGMWAFVRDITKRKEMEEELRRSRDELEIRVQERTAELVEQSKISEGFFTSTITPLVFLDKDFNFIRVNEAYAKACQRDISEFPGHNHFEFYPNEENEAIFKKVVESKTPYQAFAKPFSFPDHPEWGITYWDWTLTPLLDDEGKVEFLVFSLEDVTERKRAEESVKAERQRFNDVLETLPAYVCLLTPDYQMPFANKVFRDRFGYYPDKKCYEFLFGRSEPCEICETFTVLKTMAPHGWEWTGPDGRNYDVFDFPFTNTDGSTLILEMGIDITDRKRAEEQFKAASLYARSLIEASLDPLVTISRDGKIMDVNRETEHITGVVREQLIGSDFSDYFTEPEKAKEGYQQVFETGSVRDYPLAIRHTSGMITDVLYNATIYRNEAGEIQGVFAAARDITERKRAEDALKESENRLRHLSSQLLTVQENERKRVARELHDGIGQMLTAIKFKVESTIQEMEEGRGELKKKPLEDIIPMIKQSIEEVRRIQMDLRPSTLDDLGILATLEWFCREYQKIYFHIHIEKEIDLQETEVSIPLKTAIYRVMQEAMNNIAKHSKADLVKLSLGKQENKIQLIIQDNGQGFDLEEILSPDKFRRGMGLNSMRERTELSGGSFVVESTRGRGTVIWASWPTG